MENMCPALGRKPFEVDLACGTVTNSAQCRYKLDTIAGECTTKACVEGGINTFVTSVSELLQDSGLSPIEAGRRDRGLARLVDRLKQEGACGTDGLSCLSLLGGDCKKLSEAATEMQTQGRGILYRAFKQASEKCVADAGLRARTEDRV
jgi:hypothetical protein